MHDSAKEARQELWNKGVDDTLKVALAAAEEYANYPFEPWYNDGVEYAVRWIRDALRREA